MAEYALDKSLALLREQGLQAAEVRSTDVFRRIIRKHLELLATYFKARSSFRPVLQHQMPSMMAMMGYESRPLFALCSSLEHLIRKAFSAESQELAVAAAYGITEALAIALDNDSIQVFQRLLQLIEVELVAALFIEPATKRYELLSRITRSEDEFARYKVLGEKFEARKRPASLPQFGQTLIQAQQNALKLALDRKDLKAFKIIADSTKGLFSTGLDNPEGDLMILKLRRRNPSLDESARAQLDAQIARREEEVVFSRSVSDIKRTMFFGLAAWAVKMYQQGGFEPTQIQDTFSSLFYVFGDFESFTTLYISIVRQNREPLGWTFWSHPPQEGVKVGAVASGDTSWVDRLYVLGALKLMPETPETEEIYRTLSETDSGSIDSIAQGVRELAREVASDPALWGILVPELSNTDTTQETDRKYSATRIDRLSSFWEALVRRRRAEEERSLLEAEVSSGVATIFQEEVKKAWLENSTFRQLAARYGFLEDHLQDATVPEKLDLRGFNQLELKEWFVRGGDYTPREIGKQLGRGLAEAETQEIFRRLLMTLSRISCPSATEARARFDSYIDHLESDQAQSHVILTTFAYEFDLNLEASPHFERGGRETGQELSVNGYRGDYRAIPVISVWFPVDPNLRASICVDLRTAGVWKQYWSGEPGQQLSVRLKTIDKETGASLLRENPALGRGQSGEQLDTDDAILKLRKSVHIQILERFQYVTLERHAGLVVDWPAKDY